MNDAPYPSFAVVVIDDEETVLASVRTVLLSEGISNVVCIGDSSLALPELERMDPGLVLLDLTMPGLSGEELIPLIRLDHPGLSIVVVTGNRELDKAVECMRAGASDYLVKPVERSKLVATVRRLVEVQELQRENVELRRRYFSTELEHPEAFAGIATANRGMLALMRYIEAIAKTRNVVLITGETGTGKELLARATHLVSGRKGEMVTINAAGLDDTVFADTLFGHRSGAFTGADHSREGLVELAAGGTLFLDEIGDLAQASQIKLLRLIETGEYYPLGSDVKKRSDARIFVATNRDLQQAVKAGSFRKDLFYRVAMHHIRVPPLRERKDDIPLLARLFLEEAAREFGRKVPTPPPELFTLLQSYDFPGNVRELRSMVYDAVSRHRTGVLSLSAFREAMGAGQALSRGAEAAEKGGAALLTIREAVDDLIEAAMQKAEGNQTIAARILGITPQALGQRLKRRHGR